LSSVDLPTLVVVGAGPSLGLSIARRFGQHGFSVALIARSKPNLAELVDTLQAEGVQAAGFVADVVDRRSLSEAFVHVKDRFGPTDVLEYSPAIGGPSAQLSAVAAPEVSAEMIQPLIEHHLYGAVTAARQVLPHMIERGSGTLLFTNGPASLRPYPALANAGIALAGLRSWVLSLHAALEGTGVYAAHVVLETWIGHDGPASAPDAIAEVYWRLFTERQQAECVYRTS
jgi:NADP-dependent 3-hydroxy acid dehydrogenase YdfG